MNEGRPGGRSVLLALILAPFYLGAANSMMQSKASAHLRGTGLMIVSGVLALVIWQGAQSASAPSAPSASLPIIFALCFLVLVFLLGLGSLIGNLVARLQAKSKTRNFAVIATIAFPAVLSGLAAYQYESYRKAEGFSKTAARLAFQQQIVTAKFGKHLVTLPLTPGLTLEHSCLSRSRTCVTNWKSEGINRARADDLVLHSVQFPSLSELGDEFMRWCANRPDLVDTIWCERHLEHGFSLQVEDRNRIPWGQVAGAQLFDAPEQIKVLVCSDHWTGLHCRAIINIAPSIEAHVSSQGLTPGVAGQRALEALPEINRHWETMLKK